MDIQKEAISRDLQTQWQDHFHMRDQTWKVLQYTIIFFLGIIGLEITGVEKIVLILGYIAVICITISGMLIALHHRRRQKEKFKIILEYEKLLGLDAIIKSVLEGAHTGITGFMNTTIFIVTMHIAVLIISLVLLTRQLFN